MKQLPDKRRAKIGRLPSDIDGDPEEAQCPHCGGTYEVSAMRQDWTPTRGTVLVCVGCLEGPDE